MTGKNTKVDKATIEVAKRVLAMPPKHNADLKVGRGSGEEKRGAKVPASSSKPHGA